MNTFVWGFLFGASFTAAVVYIALEVLLYRSKKSRRR